MHDNVNISASAKRNDKNVQVSPAYLLKRCAFHILSNGPLRLAR